MKKITLIAALLFATLSWAADDNVPLSTLGPQQLVAKILNKSKLEEIAAKKSWLLNGVVQPPGFDADLAIARKKAPCAFFIPSAVLQSNEYLLYYAEHDQVETVKTHHLELTANKKFIGLTCFKHERLADLTLRELNLAFKDLISFETVSE